jgi:hypothetical protein
VYTHVPAIGQAAFIPLGLWLPGVCEMCWLSGICGHFWQSETGIEAKEVLVLGEGAMLPFLGSLPRHSLVCRMRGLGDSSVPLTD